MTYISPFDAREKEGEIRQSKAFLKSLTVIAHYKFHGRVRITLLLNVTPTEPIFQSAKQCQMLSEHLRTGGDDPCRG